MRRLRVAIDPLISPAHRPELCWTWRTILTGMGYGWDEAALDAADLDLAHAVDPSSTSARVVIVADPAGWCAPGQRRIAGLQEADGVTSLRFEQESVAPRLHRRHGGVVCQRDLAFDVYWLATGQQEPSWPRNAHGIHDLTGSPLVQEDVLRQASASRIVRAIESLLVKAGVPAPESPWPNRCQAAMCTGHDVDYPEPVPVIEPARIVARQGAAGLATAAAVATGRRHHWHFLSWVALEAEVGLRSAFYFCTRQGSLIQRAMGTPDPFYDVRAPRFRALFGQLRDAGAEIGLHASYRACESPDAIGREKAILEDAAGVEVVGNRHHYWRLNPENPAETLRFHERAGFRYDCSITFDRYLGWRRGLAWPFHPFDPVERRPLATLQIPTGWMDDQLFGQAAHNPGDREALLDALAAQVLAVRGCLMVDVHEYVFDEALYPGWAAAYRHILEQFASRTDVWCATPAEVMHHWTTRCHALITSSHGLEDRPVTPASAVA